MEQTIIYDYLGNNDDPVYQKLRTLEMGQSLELDDIDISLNKVGLYEISTEDTHDCFSDLKKCYDFICEFLENAVNEVRK